jgi:hypothetical protein
LDWIVAKIEHKAPQLSKLRRLGCGMSLGFYWVSERGHGGQQLWASQLQKIARLGLDLGFDFHPIDRMTLEEFHHLVGISPREVKLRVGSPDLVPREKKGDNFTWGYRLGPSSAFLVYFKNGKVCHVAEAVPTASKSHRKSPGKSA